MESTVEHFLRVTRGLFWFLFTESKNLKEKVLWDKLWVLTTKPLAKGHKIGFKLWGVFYWD